MSITKSIYVNNKKYIRSRGIQIKKERSERFVLFSAGGGTRTRTISLPSDFESDTSANSITPAKIELHTVLYHKNEKNQYLMQKYIIKLFVF